MKAVKNPRDFVFGLITAAIGIFLIASKSLVYGFSLFRTEIYLSRADAYLRIIGVILIIMAIILIVRSIMRADSTQKAKWQKIDWLAVSCFGAMIVYLLLIERIGFMVDTIWLMALITFLLRYREKKLNLRDRKIILKNLLISVAYAVLLVLVMSFSFTTWLKVRLP